MNPTIKLSILLLPIAIAGCQTLKPIQVGENPTGAAIIAAPSTFGTTTISTANQILCTEPRPNASVSSILDSSTNLDATQVKAVVDAQIKAGSTVGASSEFESVEFLAHGLFGVCQLAAAEEVDNATIKALAEKVIEGAKELSESDGRSGG